MGTKSDDGPPKPRLALVFSGYASEPWAASRDTGKYVERVDVDAHNGLGQAFFTADPAEALTFADLGEFQRWYRKVPLHRPFRADGQPNRPATALHLQIVTLPAGTGKPWDGK